MLTREEKSWIRRSYWACATKGVRIIIGWLWEWSRPYIVPKEKLELYDDDFGWHGDFPDLKDAWRRCFEPGSDRHDATNLLVERTRALAQGMVKFLCGLSLIAAACGILLGLIAGFLLGHYGV